MGLGLKGGIVSKILLYQIERVHSRTEHLIPRVIWGIGLRIYLKEFRLVV